MAFAFTASLGFTQTPYPGHDSKHGPATPGVFISTYTGNVRVATDDLTVAGAVGRHGLTWQRHGNSRTTGAALWFGSGHNWSHNWQWEMVDAGRDDQKRAALAVHQPDGAVHRFIEAAPGEWQAEASISQRVVSQGREFRVLLSGGGEVRFVRQGGGQNARYQLAELLDDNGNRWTFEWQGERLVQVNEPAGRWLKISYATLTTSVATGRARSSTVISRVVASDGQVVAYDYDFLPGVDYPVLTGVTYPDATRATYAYTAPRPGDRLLLKQADDPRGSREMRGRVIRYRTEPEAAAGQLAQVEAADGQGVFDVLTGDGGDVRAYQLKLPNGGILANVYHPGGNPAEDIDANGFSRKHEYSDGGRGFKLATTDALGRVTRFENDALGHVLKTIFPDGSSKAWQRDDRGRVLAETDELGQTRRYQRDGRGRVTKMTYPDGSTTETSYNDFGQVLTRKDRDGAISSTTYDARGLRTKTTNALGATTTFSYDAYDRVAATTDPRGHTTRYERDAAGRVTKTLYADGTSTSSVYNRFGQLVQSVDAAGAVRRMSYDDFGRQISTIDAVGNETRNEYAPIGEAAPWARPVRTITAAGRVTAMSYDATGRVIARTTAAGTSEAAINRTAYDAVGQQISATNPLGKTVQFFHDERGRRIKVMSTLNHATTYTYDAAGRKLSETDPKGHTTRWTYDAMGRELTKTDAKGQVTRREYNAAGRLIALTDAKLNTYRFEYDLLGRQTALVYPDGSRETTAYDAAGLKVSFTNRAGMVQTFAYDNRNREIRSEWSDGSQRVEKTYDAAGRLATQDNGISRITYQYDVAGRLVAEIQDLSPLASGGAFDPAPRTVRYSHDVDGRKDSLTYPDGSFVRYAYNARGLLASITGDDIPPPLASYEYDLAGNPTRMPRENDTATEREFDAENKATNITEHAPARRSPLSELDYTYDEAGNRTATLATLDRDGDGAPESKLDSYQYDATYQVTGASYAAPVTGVVPPGASASVGSPSASVRFTYDAVGNRLAVDENGTVTRYAVNNLNQYTQVGAFAPSHDRNGNLASMGGWVYRYDAMSRLIEATDGQTEARFRYDGKNRCVARSYRTLAPTGAALSQTLQLNTYDNWNLIEERDASGAQQARYVHGRKIDEIIVMVNRHGTFYPHHDVLGNVMMLTDKDGRLVERYTYSVTGQVTISDATGKTLTGSAVGNRWMFTGREWLQEVALYDYRNRVYSAELGRFLQTDPIRFRAGDVNIYRYVRNRYLFAIDPWGLDSVVVYGIDRTGSDTDSKYSHVFTEVNGDWVKGNYPGGVIDDSALLNDSRTFVIERNDNITPQQAQAVKDYYESQSGQWEKYSNNCGDTADDALDAAGIPREEDASTWVEIDTLLNVVSDFFSSIFDWISSLFNGE